MNRRIYLSLLCVVGCRPDPKPRPEAVHDPLRQTPSDPEPVPPSAPSTPEGMVRIAPGPGPKGKKQRRAIRYAFFVDELETTVGEYQACVDAGACTPAWDGKGSYETHCTVGKDPKLPINCVSVDQARAYCAWRGKRILVDSEWHWAAKGEQRPTPWGGPHHRLRACQYQCWKRPPHGLRSGGRTVAGRDRPIRRHA